MLEHYNRLVPGFAERFMVMAEKQADHRRDLEATVITRRSRNESWGLHYAAILAVLFGGGSFLDYHLDTLLGIAYTPGCGGRGDDGSAESPGKAGFSGSGFFFGEAPYASRRKASASGFGNTFRNASSVVHSLGFFFIGCPHEPDRPDS
jgi:hypothetical protein